MTEDLISRPALLEKLRELEVEYEAYAPMGWLALMRVQTMVKLEPAVTRENGEWKYYRKQGIAVCTSCSFERKVDDNFGRAVACPNCGADMRRRGNDATD